MRVVFRKFKDDGSIIALFPDDPCDLIGNITSYMHVGQHSGASPALINDFEVVDYASKPEIKPLLNELIAIGYKDLEVCDE